MRRTTILLLAMTSLSATHHAFAASKQTKERAAEESATKERAAKERAAKKACLAGDPARGVEILAELYVDTNDTTYIFNQGRCFQQNRRYDDAVGRFREYLIKGEEHLPAEDKAVALKHIESCESYLPKSEPRSAPASESAPVAPLVRPRATEVTAEPTVARVAKRRSRDDNAGSGLRIAGITVGAVGAAALISGVLLNLKVNSMSSDLEKPEGFNRDTDSTRKTYKTLGWVGYGVGTAGLVGGAVLYYLGLRAELGVAPTLTLAPGLGTGTAGAVLVGAF